MTQAWQGSFGGQLDIPRGVLYGTTLKSRWCHGEACDWPTEGGPTDRPDAVPKAVIQSAAGPKGTGHVRRGLSSASGTVVGWERELRSVDRKLLACEDRTESARWEALGDSSSGATTLEITIQCHGRLQYLRITTTGGGGGNGKWGAALSLPTQTVWNQQNGAPTASAAISAPHQSCIWMGP